jgi:hypothetical protein
LTNRCNSGDNCEGIYNNNNNNNKYEFSGSVPRLLTASARAAAAASASAPPPFAPLNYVDTTNEKNNIYVESTKTPVCCFDCFLFFFLQSQPLAARGTQNKKNTHLITANITGGQRHWFITLPLQKTRREKAESNRIALTRQQTSHNKRVARKQSAATQTRQLQNRRQSVTHLFLDFLDIDTIVFTLGRCYIGVEMSCFESAGLRERARAALARRELGLHCVGEQHGTVHTTRRNKNAIQATAARQCATLGFFAKSSVRP